jgi:hypothetical protein
MSEASFSDQSESISDQLVALAGKEHHNIDIDTGDPVDDWYRARQHDACPESALEWRGPVAFARPQGAVPGIDHDLGTSWGPNGDQRVSLRIELGGEAGLLYVHDPTWDEYAVLGSDVPLTAVEDAFGRALRLGEQVAVEDFVALLPNVVAVRLSGRPEL